MVLLEADDLLGELLELLGRVGSGGDDDEDRLRRLRLVLVQSLHVHVGRRQLLHVCRDQSNVLLHILCFQEFGSVHENPVDATHNCLSLHAARRPQPGYLPFLKCTLYFKQVPLCLVTGCPHRFRTMFRRDVPSRNTNFASQRFVRYGTFCTTQVP